MKLKKIGEYIINNWPVKILSIALALLLFFFCRLNTTESHYIVIPLEVMLNNDLVVADPYPAEIRVTLRGKSENFFLINEKDITAYVDFSSKEKSGYYRGPVRIKKRGNALQADLLEVKVDPREVRLKVEKRFREELETGILKQEPEEQSMES